MESYYIIKTGACFKAEFGRHVDENNMTLHIACRYEVIDIDTVDEDNLSVWFKEIIEDKVMKKVEEFEVKGSGWKFESITELEVRCMTF